MSLAAATKRLMTSHCTRGVEDKLCAGYIRHQRHTIDFLLHPTERRWSLLEQSNIKRGGIYMVRMGNGVGSEQSGRRPFLVLQNDKGNEHSFTHSGVPLTTELKSLYMPTHIVTRDSKILPYDSVVLAEQVRTLARWRFDSCLGHLDKRTLDKVSKAVAIQLGIDDIGDINKVEFVLRLTEVNPALNAFLCGKCLRLIYGIKGLTVTGNPEVSCENDFCILCHKEKGNLFRVVNRERIHRNGQKIERFRHRPH